MKKQSLRISLMCGLLALIAAASAQAQTSNEQTASIPFSFTVAGKNFPAGEYRITRLNPTSDKAALSIKSMDGRMSKIVLTTPVQARETRESARLIFTRYGEQYFLSQVWTPADNTGLELPKSRVEATLAKHPDGEKPARVIVALSARQR